MSYGVKFGPLTTSGYGYLATENGHDGERPARPLRGHSRRIRPVRVMSVCPRSDRLANIVRGRFRARKAHHKVIKSDGTAISKSAKLRTRSLFRRSRSRAP